MILRDITYSREYNRVRYGVDRAEQIGAPYWPSLDGALRELRRLSGVLPGVRYPLGGSRTDAEGRLANPYLDPSLSDHNYRKACAYDADNRGAIIAGIAARQGVTFARAVGIYYGTLALFGWRNVQIDDSPFPLEPWHNANHDIFPAGYGSTPLPSTPSTPAPITETDPFMPKVIVDEDTSQKYRYAVWDSNTQFDFITGTLSQQKTRRDRKLKIIGQSKPVPLSPGEFLAELADVNANRVQTGLSEIVRPT